MRSRPAAAIAVVAVAGLVVYLPVLSALVRQWASDDNYSHGFFIVPLALFFAWERRAALARTEVRPSAAGLAIVPARLLPFLLGRPGPALLLPRLSLIRATSGPPAVL